MPVRRWNRYRDVEIDVSRLQFTDEAQFLRVIADEKERWQRRLKYPSDRETAVMWLNVPRELVKVVPWLLNLDPPFIMHHANAQRIMLVLPASSRCQVPSYGTHYVKVECVVVEEMSGRILMIRERIGSDAPLKLVTGSAEAGEFVASAAEREVWEETRIRATVSGIIGCGNRVRTRFDRDEIIVGCLLFAKQNQFPRPDGYEVREASWMDISQAAGTCAPMAREWLAAATASRNIWLPRVNTTDIFRGHPYMMDFYVPRIPTMS